jgi:hydrogenase maturation protease
MVMKIEAKSSSPLIMGIGNPILTDDSVGLKIARGLKERRPDLDIVETMETGVGMLDVIAGYERLIIIDSIRSGNDKPGSLYRLQIPNPENPISFSCAHGSDILSAIRLGQSFGHKIPGEIVIYAVEIEDNRTFGEECTRAVFENIPVIIEEILKDLDQSTI